MINKYFENIYQNVLLPELKEGNNCSSTECSIYDFSLETINYINDLIYKKANNIKNQISLIKQNYLDINIENKIEMSMSGLNILKEIYDSLKTFLSIENEDQGSKINLFIQNTIKSNLNDFLNNVVPFYGNAFFERIIDYNINFKIVFLYENLHYGISKTLLYYHSLREANEYLNCLPFDLKTRLYNLNDLDLTVVNKNKEIKILLEKIE